MEKLSFRFEQGHRKLKSPTQLVGVVSSGNLEVMINTIDLSSACEIEINTEAVGFGKIWEAVISDFNKRWQLADVRVEINDMGATPAVVILRLDQAVEAAIDAASGAVSGAVSDAKKGLTK